MIRESADVLFQFELKNLTYRTLSTKTISLYLWFSLSPFKQRKGYLPLSSSSSCCHLPQYSPFRIRNLVHKHCLRFSRAIDREWAEVHRSIIEYSLGRSLRVRLSIAFVSPRALQVPSHALTNRDVKQMSRSTIQTMFPPKMSLWFFKHISCLSSTKNTSLR